MSFTWMLESVGMYVTTVGALLIFLYLWKSPKTINEWLAANKEPSYATHRRRLVFGSGLLAAWIFLQYFPRIFL